MTSKLSFEDYCLQRKENVRFEEIETDEEDESGGEEEGSDEDNGSDEMEDDERNDKSNGREHYYIQHDY